MSQALGDLKRDELEPFGVHQIGFGEDGDPCGDAELLQDGKMLLRLRHDPLVRRHDQECQIDARGTGNHGPNEVFVARDVHHPHHPANSEIECREIEVDRDLATALLGQPVHRLPGERGNQRGLAVVDVPRGADDHAAAQARWVQNSRAGRSAPSARW